MAWPVLGLEVFLAAISDLLDTAVKQYTYFLDVIKSNSRRRLENPLLIFHLRPQFRRGPCSDTVQDFLCKLDMNLPEL